MEVKGEIEEDSSRNLLQRFGGGLSGDAPPEFAGGGDTCEVELSLGLSLNGCFGAEPKEKRLTRSSSISSFSLFPIEHNVPLTRTCSLPSETEEVRRKRKEVESFKRMEVKRKRSEKKVVKDRKDEDFDDDLNNLRNGQNDKGGQVFAGKMSGIAVNGRRTTLGAQGSCSSSVLDFESKPTQGIILSASNQTNQKASTDKNVTAIASASNHTNQKVSATAEVKREGDEPSRKKSCRTNGMRESERNMMEEMPCVSTKGDGPDGRRVEGFLYRYRKGEVRIVCVCHGQFLTPAEFVKHARGGDVAHPLRHIVVNTTPALL